MMMRAYGLGKRQREILEIMAHPSGSYEEWHEGCGWVYGTPSATDRLLASISHGGSLVERTHENYRGSGYGRYILAAYGREAGRAEQKWKEWSGNDRAKAKEEE
jgi:hypothetical protein